METPDRFKNSPIHDKSAILELMDELKPEQMAELVDYLQKRVKLLRQQPVMVRSEQLPCSHCGRPLKEHSKDSKLCPGRMKNFEQGN
jgi:hypothetical protein